MFFSHQWNFNEINYFCFNIELIKVFIVLFYIASHYTLFAPNINKINVATLQSYYFRFISLPQTEHKDKEKKKERKAQFKEESKVQNHHSTITLYKFDLWKRQGGF